MTNVDPMSQRYGEQVRAAAVARRARKRAVRAEFDRNRDAGLVLRYSDRLARLANVSSMRPSGDGSGAGECGSAPDTGTTRDESIPF